MDVTLYLVRHGEAAGAWDQSTNPGLSDLGREQAESVATRLKEELSPLPLFTSPLKRTRETSEPLARLWNREAEVAPPLTEIPSTGIDFKDRRNWLNNVMQQSWPDQAGFLLDWRSNLIKFAQNMTGDAVLITHFVVINCLVGACEGDDRVLIFRPNYCSVTRIRVTDGELGLIEKGSEAVTVVK